MIFIVDRDIFGLGLPLYRVERCVLGEGSDEVGEVLRLFGDGAHIVFVNGEKRDGDTPLSLLLHDIFCPDPAKMHYRELREALERHKTVDGGSEKMREAFSTWEERIGERYLAQGIAIGEERGIARGREEGKRLLVCVLLKGGYTLEQVAHDAELPLDGTPPPCLPCPRGAPIACPGSSLRVECGRLPGRGRAGRESRPFP